jgi:hypothetical protein
MKEIRRIGCNFMRYQLIISSLCVSTFLGCGLGDNDIRKGWWKHGSGFSIGDVISFDDKNYRNDTILIDNRPIAVIESGKKAFVGGDNEIVVRALLTNEKGFYYQK